MVETSTYREPGKRASLAEGGARREDRVEVKLRSWERSVVKRVLRWVSRASSSVCVERRRSRMWVARRSVGVGRVGVGLESDEWEGGGWARVGVVG